MSAYLAVGVWHHWLVRRDSEFVRRYWPAVRRALDWVVSMQLPWGGIAWSQEWPDGRPAGQRGCAAAPAPRASTTSLRAGVALSELIDDPQPEWELAGGRLGHALREHRDLFLDKSTSRWTGTTPCSAARSAASGRAAARGALGRLRGARARHQVRRHQPVGDRGRDLRAGDGARRARRPRPRAGCSSPTCSTCAAPSGRYWTGYVYPRRRQLAGGAHDLHGRGRDPGGRRASASHPGVRHHARREPAGAVRGVRAGVWLPGLSRPRPRRRRAYVVAPASSRAPRPR